MTDYPYGYCGMPCALCSRYRTDGKSRCTGCSDGGYYTAMCKVYRCCGDKSLTHCAACDVFPCVRLEKMGDFRDLNTGNVKQRTCAAVAKNGFDVWYAEYCEKASLLTIALEKYNNGRMKRFLCELFIQRDIGMLREIMRRAENLTCDAVERPSAFRKLTEQMMKVNDDTDSERDEHAVMKLRSFEDSDMELFKKWLYAEHIAKWYEHPLEWLDEIEKRNDEFLWIHHYIAEYNGLAVGFCQYYEYSRGGELWHGTTDISGAYSIDYLIGDADFIGKGLGRRMIRALLMLISQRENARIVIVQPDARNKASCAALLSAGFIFDDVNGIYRLEL